MSASLWNSLLHLLKSLWNFLCQLCHYLLAKRDSTPVLPVVLPPHNMAQQVIINICAPPEDLVAGDVPSTPNITSDYQRIRLTYFGSDPEMLYKQELLRTPGSCRIKPRYQEQTHAAPDVAIPNIHIQNWDNPQPTLPDVHTSSLAFTVSPSPSVPPALNASAITTSPLLFTEAPITPSNPPPETFGLDTAVSLPNDELVESHECLQPAQDVDNEQIHGLPVPPIIESSGEILMPAFEPIKYTPSVLSAGYESNFWDIPFSDTARMVPLPLCTSTPPRPCSPLSIDQKHMRLSLLPYADLFDFSMYNSMSQDSFDQFSFGDLPPAPSIPATADPTPRPSEIAYRDRYRNSAYSEPTGPYSFKSVTMPLSSEQASNGFASSDRKHLREISLNSIGFNSPLITKRMSGVPATGICDSTFSTYSQSSASSVDLS